MIKKYVLWRYWLRIDISNDENEILKTTGLIGKNLFQSKKGYGKGVFLYGLLLATKFKYCIVNDENVQISQKNNLQRLWSEYGGIEFQRFSWFRERWYFYVN